MVSESTIVRSDLKVDKAVAPKTLSYRIGLILLAISAILFFAPVSIGAFLDESQAFSLFLIHFGITVSYFFVGKKIIRGGVRNSDDKVIFLLLFLISAYALNRCLPVFEQSTGWFAVLLLLVSSSYLAIAQLHRLPDSAKYALGFLLGVGTLTWLYLSLFLIPLYALSLIVSPVLGLSLHSFVPLMLLTFSVFWIVSFWKQERILIKSLCAGIMLPACIVAVFCFQWTQLEKSSSQAYQNSLIDYNNNLPSWVKVARQLPDNWATKAFLKGGMVYSDREDMLGFGDFPNLRFNESRKHDPLVFIASQIAPVRHLTEEDRIKILESKYDARHNTEQRLWRGDDLRTTNVVTNAQIWPSQHLAYTEQIITVANLQQKASWPRQQEAVYTFHLPEGSAVTSLSLWINGIEEKAMLTSKGKAATAYRQIVGVEQRDPSLVQWAEGNRISVRVFPVVSGENRIFKIGVTTPLLRHSGRLEYQPVWFEGPQIDKTEAITQLSIDGKLQHARGLGRFNNDGQGHYRFEGNYDNAWGVTFDDVPVKQVAFSFNNATYTLQEYMPHRIPAETQRIYLDLNNSWTRSEFNQICKLAEGRELYASLDKIIPITKDNQSEIFSAAEKFDFSLFPFFEIGNPETDLIISKSTSQSPNIADLNGSGFGARLERALQQQSKYRLFTLGDSLSPYLKSLKEHRAFRLEQGSVDDLRNLVSKNEFADDPETDQSVVINDAGLRITKTAGTLAGSGPDHLQRLFAYNHIIQNMGKNLYKDMESNEDLQREASEAYVVSPISSLVVLESAVDYQRFDIHENKTSLRNASVSSAGAVPEPHEWALIAMAIGLLIWLRFRQHPVLAFVKRNNK